MSLALRITNAGRAALVNAAHDGTNAVRITSVGVSSIANGPDPTLNFLPGERKRINTISGGETAADVIHLTVRDESADSYTVRSFSLYLADGTMFALYGQADPIIEKSTGALLLLAIDATLLDVAASQITFGDANFLNPAATTDTPGVVRMAKNAEGRGLSDPRLSLSPANLGDIINANILLADRGELPASQIDQATGNGIYRVAQSFYVDTLLTLTQPSSTGTVQLLFGYQGALAWRNRRDNLEWGAFNLIWHSGNDGAGSGLDADMIAGHASGSIMLDRGSIDQNVLDSATANGFYSLVRGGFADSMLTFTSPSSTGTVQLIFSYQGGLAWRNRRDNNSWTSQKQIWHSENDGAGSGLDADMLDGKQASEFANVSHSHGAADLAGAFSGVLNGNGYVVLPNGLIIQWATGAPMSPGVDATQLVYFPVVFPNACYNAVVSTMEDAFSVASDAMFSSIGWPTRDQVTVIRKSFGDGSRDIVASRPFVIAVGR